jgi:hypothetical protein
MPNWCYNKTTITGNRDELLKFKNGLQWNTNCYTICESFFPCPQELRDTVSGFFGDSEKQAELEAKSQANIEKYGYANWYDWSNAMWGSKWGDCETVMEFDGEKQIVLSYNSAWSPITEALQKISTDFPLLKFHTQVDEEGGFFAGVIVIQDGETLCEALYEPSSYAGEIDWDNYDTIEAYENWKDEQMEKMLKTAESV